MEKVLPYQNKPAHKKAQIGKMFDSISHRYDMLNRILSLRIDVLWRRKALALLGATDAKKVLDIATGTGDLAIMAAKKMRSAHITGIDLSNGMLKIGQQKVQAQGLKKRIDLVYGDAEALSFDDNTFEVVMVAFGVRNFESLYNGLQECYRVLQPGGKLMILEFSQPIGGINFLFSIYFKRILPLIGKWLSGDKAAYGYLTRSVAAFVQGEQLIELLEKHTFKHTKWQRLTAGIASVYLAQK